MRANPPMSGPHACRPRRADRRLLLTCALIAVGPILGEGCDDFEAPSWPHEADGDDVIVSDIGNGIRIHRAAWMGREAVLASSADFDLRIGFLGADFAPLVGTAYSPSGLGRIDAASGRVVLTAARADASIDVPPADILTIDLTTGESRRVHVDGSPTVRDVVAFDSGSFLLLESRGVRLVSSEGVVTAEATVDVRGATLSRMSADGRRVAGTRSFFDSTAVVLAELDVTTTSVDVVAEHTVGFDVSCSVLDVAPTDTRVLLWTWEEDRLITLDVPSGAIEDVATFDGEPVLRAAWERDDLIVVHQVGAIRELWLEDGTWTVHEIPVDPGVDVDALMLFRGDGTHVWGVRLDIVGSVLDIQLDAGGAARTAREWIVPIQGPLLDMTASPDGDRIAILTDHATSEMVIEIVGDGEIRAIDSPPGVTLAWLDDGLYVIGYDPDGVIVTRLSEDGSTIEPLHAYPVPPSASRSVLTDQAAGEMVVVVRFSRILDPFQVIWVDLRTGDVVEHAWMSHLCRDVAPSSSRLRTGLGRTLLAESTSGDGRGLLIEPFDDLLVVPDVPSGATFAPHQPGLVWTYSWSETGRIYFRPIGEERH